jgi:hypothetical protein
VSAALTGMLIDVHASRLSDLLVVMSEANKIVLCHVIYDAKTACTAGC